MTRKMVAEDIGLRACRFTPAYSSACGQPTTNANGICSAHTKVCAVCCDLATSECSYCGQFVCGTPLCDHCEGWNDSTKSSGSWGFMNHAHRRKATAPPILKMTASDIGLPESEEGSR